MNARAEPREELADRPRLRLGPRRGLEAALGAAVESADVVSAMAADVVSQRVATLSIFRECDNGGYKKNESKCDAENGH